MSCQLICPNLRCRKILKVPNEVRGKVVRCQYCQTMLRVPPARRDSIAPPPEGRDTLSPPLRHTTLDETARAAG